MSFVLILFSLLFSFGAEAKAYPIFAQKLYSTPREETRRIVCANCHLAAKPVSLELPQSIFPSQVFNAEIKIPSVEGIKQVVRNGNLRPLNVRRLCILPKGFEMASPSQLSTEQKKDAKSFYFQQYNAENPNMYVIGPLPAKKYSTVRLYCISPKNADVVPYGSYSVFVGGNRGRGQIYPDGSKSNNRVFTSPVKGQITEILFDKKSAQIVIETGSKRAEVEIPNRPKIIVKKDQLVQADEPLTDNPNVGGFRQAQSEFVFQSPNRVRSLQIFLWSVFIAQTFLVLKKKQIEQTQSL